MNIILITKPDIEIIVIQEHLLYVYICYSLDMSFLWKIYIAIKVKDVVGQEYVYFSISKTETPGWLQFVY